MIPDCVCVVGFVPPHYWTDGEVGHRGKRANELMEMGDIVEFDVLDRYGRDSEVREADRGCTQGVKTFRNQSETPEGRKRLEKREDNSGWILVVLAFLVVPNCQGRNSGCQSRRMA